MPDSTTIAKACAKCAWDIRAADIAVLDLRGISPIADYFVICTGTSIPHLKAISRDIREHTTEELAEKPRSSDGDARSMWLVIDYVDVVVHIFHEEKRNLYALEELWKDAPRVESEWLPAESETVNAAG